jgi:molybdopterin molybdotransferase
MDGYAIKLQDSGEIVKLKDTIFAGDNNKTKLKSKKAIKIMTGARVPEGTEAIVPYELVEVVDENHIKLPSAIKPNQHIRFVGEDIKSGEILVDDGDTITSGVIGVLASQGITHIQVYKVPKVAIFASGEELKMHFEDATDYQIYNSNTPYFLSRVKELGCKVSFVGSAKDNIKSLKEHIYSALDADLIITSGGVSVGDADFTKEAFEEFEFESIFDGIYIKPGKPTVFGVIQNSFVLNLPGNPLASALVFEYFGKILIQCLKGSNKIFHNTIEAKLKTKLQNKAGRYTIIPGFFDGEFFEASQKRSPGMVNVLNHCNSIIVVDKNCNEIEKNTFVKVLPISWDWFSMEQKNTIS